MTTPNHRNTRLTPCTCPRQLNQQHRRSRTRKAPKEPHSARWPGAQEGVVQLSCVPVNVYQLLERLESLLPLFIVIGHKCNELARNAIEARPLEEQLFGDDQAQEVAKRMLHGLDCGL